MAQASSGWQQLLNRIQSRSLPRSTVKLQQPLLFDRFKGREGWILGFGVAVVLLLWNWKFMLSTSTGLLVMFATYSMQQWDWGGLWDDLRQGLVSFERQLTVAVVTGAMATLATYMLLAIWVGTENFWIASGLVIQGMATMTGLGLLLWQRFGQEFSGGNGNFDRLLSHLSEVDPLKRLIAVRQMIQLLDEGNVDLLKRQAISECLRLMLRREPEAIVREAILEGLQVLDETKTLAAGTPPLSIPLSRKPATNARRKIVATVHQDPQNQL